MSEKRHWECDRNYELAFEFANDGEMIGDAMAMWLALDEGAQFDKDNMVTAFMHMDKCDRYDILVKYIEETGQEYEFDQWYSENYLDDEEGDYRPDYDDDKYEKARDMMLGEMHFEDGIFGLMGIDADGLQEDWDKMIERGY